MPVGEHPEPIRPRRSHCLARRLRLAHQRQFLAVYRLRRKRHAGPLVIYAKPNGLGHPRLGLSVSKRVGKATTRNRIRRRLREAFRLMQHDLPAGYDLVINVRPHEPLMLAEYQRLLAKAARQLHQSWMQTPEAANAESTDAR